MGDPYLEGIQRRNYRDSVEEIEGGTLTELVAERMKKQPEDFNSTKMRRFQLHRKKDISGVSGIGIVAEGVQFSDGICVLRWISDKASTAMYDSLEDLIGIHDHKGTKNVGHNSIRFIDE